MDMRAETRKLAPNCAGDFERKPTFEPGQLVWSQYNEIDGPGLWPATVRTQRCDMITVEWENPDGENPTFIAHCSKLRERPICAAVAVAAAATGDPLGEGSSAAEGASEREGERESATPDPGRCLTRAAA